MRLVAVTESTVEVEAEEAFVAIEDGLTRMAEISFLGVEISYHGIHTDVDRYSRARIVRRGRNSANSGNR